MGLTGAGGVIFADAGGGWSIGFPVESEATLYLDIFGEAEEKEVAHRVLCYADTRIQRPEKVLAMAHCTERFRQILAGVLWREGWHCFVLIRVSGEMD
jgi:hypothetical protein